MKRAVSEHSKKKHTIQKIGEKAWWQLSLSLHLPQVPQFGIWNQNKNNLRDSKNMIVNVHNVFQKSSLRAFSWNWELLCLSKLPLTDSKNWKCDLTEKLNGHWKTNKLLKSELWITDLEYSIRLYYEFRLEYENQNLTLPKNNCNTLLKLRAPVL